MMYPKPKSAPARVRQSKFVKSRTNAMKEIEAWVRKDDDPMSSHEASRMSGQLTDNVTEERMLRSKLWELSKERYKFLAQNAYEKKMFTDRIQRKSSALLRRSSSSSNVDHQQPVQQTDGSTRARQRWKNARLALLDRLDPTKKGKDKDKDKDKEGTKQTKEKKEGRRGSGVKSGAVLRAGGAVSSRTGTPAATGITVTPAVADPANDTRQRWSGTPVLSPISGSTPLTPGADAAGGEDLIDSPFRTSRNAPLPAPYPDSRNVKFRQTSGGGSTNHVPLKLPLSRTQSSSSSTLASPRQHLSAGPRSASSPSFFNRPKSGVSSKPNSATSKRTTTSSVQAATDTLRETWVNRKNQHGRYGMRLDSMTTDPRYAQLEKSLAPVDHHRVHKPPPDVTTIVNHFDSLHMPPRRRKEAKPKTGQKVLEYMEEQGFVF